MHAVAILELIKEWEPVFDPKWLHSALLLSLFSTYVVIGVFAYLNRFEKKSYLNYWMVAWMLYAIWLGACIQLERSPTAPWLLMAQRACIGASALCMFWGSLAMLNRGRSGRELVGGIALIVCWSYVAAYEVRDHFWITAPVFLLLAAASVFSGSRHLYYRGQYRGATLLASGFILWGVHLLVFPLQPWLSPLMLAMAHFMTAVLALFIALGMIVLVLEQAQERHRELLEEFKQSMATRRDLEQEAVISEQKYRALFHASGEAIFLVDMETLEIAEANEEAQRLVLGRNTEGDMPKSFHSILPELRGHGASAFETSRRITAIIQPSREFAILRANGTLAPCEGSVTMVEQNRRPVLVVTMREISERKQFEQQLRRSEKLSALGQLVAGVAHELNNPLAVIMGYAQILTAQEHPPKRAHTDLQKILHESERAAKIVRNLLNFARPRDPHMAPVDINALVVNVTENYEAEMESAAIQFHLDLQPELPRTMADSHQMEQVLNNLITNAVHALSEHNGVRRLDVCTERQGAKLRITIADTGLGIPPEVIPRIFDPFYTTKGPGKGTGLGLSICHSIIQEHHGRISVESDLAKGTRFYVELPIVRCPEPVTVPAPPVPQSEPAKPAGDAPRHRILLVDDEPGILEVLRTLLEENGYVIEVANNGLQALELIQAASYDLVISDLCMPGLGGEALYERVCQLSPALGQRMMFITGDTVSGTSRTFLESTGNHWLAKPFNLAEIEKTVRECLKESAR